MGIGGLGLADFFRRFTKFPQVKVSGMELASNQTHDDNTMSILKINT